MAVDDPQLRYATNTLDADGTTTDWEISFVGGYIRPEDVGCFSVLFDEETGLTSDRQVHSVSILSSSGNAATVRVTPAVAAGRKIVIYRDTQKTSMMVQYQDGSIISKKNLDLANTQLLMLIQEILDTANSSSLTVEEAVSSIVDINSLVQSIYEEVLTLLASGGIVSVEPRKWFGEGNGEDTDFPLLGADVSSPGFYDTYLDGEGLEPGVDYTILPSDGTDPFILRFTVAPPLGIRWFTVLRGYARPYTGPTPLTTLRIPMIPVTSSTYFVDVGDDSATLLVNNAVDSSVSVRIPLQPLAGDESEKLGTGSFFSAKQVSTATVEIVADDPGVTLVVPEGYLPKTRVVGSTISAYCDSGDSNIWTLGGDLAVDPSYLDTITVSRFHKVLASGHSNSTVTVSTPSGFSAPVVAGKVYRIRGRGTYQTVATTTGCIIGLLGAGGAAGIVQGRASGAITNTAAATQLSIQLTALSGAGSTLTTTGVAVINTPHWVDFEVIFVCTTSGTVSLAFASEVASSAATLNAGFCYSVEQIPVNS